MGIKKGNSLGVPFFGFKRKRRDKNTFASSAMSHFQYITARWRVRLCRLLDILCIHILLCASVYYDTHSLKIWLPPARCNSVRVTDLVTKNGTLVTIAHFLPISATSFS